MSTTDARRPLIALAVPPGAAGLEALIPALEAALDGSGPAIAALPTTGPAGYRESLRAALRPEQDVPAGVAVVAATSGSTGDPAGVLLPAPALRSAAAGFATMSGQPGGHRWVAALPLHHAGGLMVAVRATVAGTQPVPVASLGGAQPFSVAAFEEATRRAVALSERDGLPIAVSLVPPMLAMLDAAGEPGWELLSAYGAVLVGGAATPRSLVERLLVAGVHVFTSYGMTETCGGVVFDGRPLPGTSVSRTPDGRLRICGAQVALGYRDGRDPGRWGTGPDGSRCFLTGDLGEVSPEGSVRVVGRVDDVVQVGGSAVSVGAVAEVLRAAPGVSAAEVVAVPDGRFGATVVALVVAARAAPGSDGPGGPGARPELPDMVEAALGRPARPRVVRWVSAIPMLAAGKPDRAALGALAREALAGAQPEDRGTQGGDPDDSAQGGDALPGRTRPPGESTDGRIRP